MAAGEVGKEGRVVWSRSWGRDDCEGLRESEGRTQSKAEEYKGVQGTLEGRENLAPSGQSSLSKEPEMSLIRWWLWKCESLRLLYLPGR